jgi:RND family efflux transporter MFP subunit
MLTLCQRYLITIGIFGLIITSNSYAAPSFPPNLSDIEGENNTSNPKVSSPIKTPEYVIIKANEETTFSSETTGSINYLPVKEGSHFSVGQVLLGLDCTLQEAELKKAKAEQHSAYKAYQSAKKLKAYGAISELELVKSTADAVSANAEVDKLQAIVKKCRVIAPFSGGVSEIKVHLYETVKPGDPLLKVTNTENLSVEIQVPSSWLSWLRIGSTFKVYINDINKTLAAKVNYINPAIEPISQTVKISGQISPPNTALRPGMTGQAFFNDNPELKGTASDRK